MGNFSFSLAAPGSEYSWSWDIGPAVSGNLASWRFFPSDFTPISQWRFKMLCFLTFLPCVFTASITMFLIYTSKASVYTPVFSNQHYMSINSEVWVCRAAKNNFIWIFDFRQGCVPLVAFPDQLETSGGSGGSRALQLSFAHCRRWNNLDKHWLISTAP